ncbi:MAG: hypothetical protein LBB79_00775 [Prevotellaceae bacterium]|jgi:hypothetical protein|nr:hypothetical protein [Prevotellaceae bacterium]
MKTQQILTATLLLCATIVVSAQEEKPKVAIIKRSTMEAITYVDFAGGRSASEAYVLDILAWKSGNTRYYHQRVITDSVSTTVIDLDAKTGVRYPYPAFSEVKHPDSLLAQGYRKVGEEEVHGRICDKYVLDDSLQYKKHVAQRRGKNSSPEEALDQITYPDIFKHLTVWLWHGVVIQSGKSDHQSGKLVVVDDILDIQENVPLPAEKFEIPEGVTLQLPKKPEKWLR